MESKKALRIILLLFLIQVVVKIILSSLIHSPTIFGDEYDYMKMARSFFYSQNFLINGALSPQYLPLYPMVLSLSYFFHDMNWVYFIAKCINAVLSSLVIFPAYLLAREFLSSRKALLTAVLVSVLPACFSFAPYIMSENLIFSVTLFAFYFIYKSFVIQPNQSYKYDILAGLFIGLAYLTKITGLLLIPMVLLMLLISIFKKEYSQVKKKIVMLAIAFLVMSPWLIRNTIHFGFGISSLFGNTSTINEGLSKFYILPFIEWIIMHLGYAILASGILFFVISAILLFNFSKENKKLFNLTLMSFLFLILIVCFTTLIVSRGSVDYTNQLVGRLIGRHIDLVLPLFIILGCIGLNQKIEIKASRKIMLLLFSVFLLFFFAFLSTLNYFSLFPANNLSLSVLGVFHYILIPVTKYYPVILSAIFALLLCISVFYYNKLRFKSWALIFIIYFLCTSLLSYGITCYNSEHNWLPSAPTQLGMWFNSYSEKNSVVLFDNSCRLDDVSDKNKKPLLIAGFWMNNQIIIDDETEFKKADYMISCKKIPYKIIKQIGEDIFIYRK